MSEENLNEAVEAVEVAEEVVEEVEVKPELKYTDEDVDSIVKKKLAKAERDKAEAVKQAEKLAKMNADEKERYEREQLEARLAEYERKEAQYGLAKEANNMLVEQGIQANDTIVELLVKNDAETTQSAVKAIIDWVNDLQKQWEVKRNTGVTPKRLENTPADPFAEAIKKFK